MPNKLNAQPREAYLRLRLPATSANLGPAFDAAALALNLYITIEARPAKEFCIRATGRDEEICGTLHDDHLILSTYREVLEDREQPVIALAFTIRNEIPIGKGCGSSAAARLTGIALANHFGKFGWNDAQIIGEASRREHHPDNASACWMGGMAIARMSGESEAQIVSIRPKGKWPILLAVSGQRLSTEEARRVLPAHYARVDAVSNIQSSMLLLAAFTQGRHDLLPAALEDRIHQPYRAPLCPLLAPLQELSGKHGVLGVALSGAGPSVLIFLDPKSEAVRVKEMVAAHLAHAGLDAELIATSIALQGGSGSFRRN